MLPKFIGSHKDYQNFVVENLKKYYPNPDSITQSTWTIIDHFWNLDLSFCDEYMKSKYSHKGSTARVPSCMHRSYLLSIAFKITSITEWVAQLRINPLFAIISGFDVNNTPGIGTFYDFINRLWDLPENNLLPNIRPAKQRVQKPALKGHKANPVSSLTTDELFQIEKISSHDIHSEPYASLFMLYKNEFLDKSVSKGLISTENLSLAGDGTPVVTSNRERKHHVCKCKENGISDCNCNLFFSQPDCDIGWDSSRDCFYHGYDLYMLNAPDSDSDLPVFAMLNPASMHDSHGFIHTFFRMKSFLSDFKVKKLLLDSAHDAMPYYKYCKENGITPFIDLNDKRKGHVKYKDDFTLAHDGVPICKAGLRMHHDGVEKQKYRAKYKCPLMNRNKGCSCESPCTDSPYGRTVHTATKDNPRLFNIPPRDSNEWKLEYNARTSVERSNKREKIDFKLEGGRHRSSKMWYCRLYHIMMLQHLDAWDLPFESTLRKLILNVA